MFEFHKNRKQYFEMQVNNAAQFVIPFIEQKINIIPGMQVLEIGCGEGGVLKAFINKGNAFLSQLNIALLFTILTNAAAQYNKASS
jgi:cyclopropane fatty-acyl-phospholipid synthase-like methyltransferase